MRRFISAWEAAASPRLRKGDVSALAEYAGHGRIYSGPQDRVFDDAVPLYINGLLGGEEALLMATSNETATRLAGLVRERLVEMGRVARDADLHSKRCGLVRRQGDFDCAAPRIGAFPARF